MNSRQNDNQHIYQQKQEKLKSFLAIPESKREPWQEVQIEILSRWLVETPNPELQPDKAMSETEVTRFHRVDIRELLSQYGNEQTPDNEPEFEQQEPGKPLEKTTEEDAYWQALEMQLSAENVSKTEPVTRGNSIETPNTPKSNQWLSAADIRSMDIAPTKWVIQDLLPEGVAILSGPPKAGKTWLAMQIAITAATGGTILGYKAQKHGVLYLDYETLPYNRQQRIKQLADTNTRLDRLNFSDKWPKVKNGGVADLDNTLSKTPDIKLVIIDTWERFNPATGGRKSAYAKEVEAVEPLNALVSKYHCCILLVTHSKSRGTKHGIDSVGGSYGFTGAADTVLTLSGNKLEVTGRGVTVQPLNVKQDSNAAWVLTDEPVAIKLTVKLTTKQKPIYDYLLLNGGKTPSEIKAALGLTVIVSAISHRLDRMVENGYLVNNKGRYSVNQTVTE